MLTGQVLRRPLEPDRPVDVADAVDLLRVVADALALDQWTLDPGVVAGYHPTRTARLVVQGRALGHAGELTPTAAALAAGARPVVALELDVTALVGRAATRPRVP